VNDLLDTLIATAREAGRAAMVIYQSDFAVTHKDDRSPVTEADVAAERVILAALAKLTPDIPTISEEATAGGKTPDFGQGRFWLVDPLDGTKEFVARTGQFTVNIGLIEHGRPILGVVHAPAVDETFAGGASTAFRLEPDSRKRPIACRVPPPEGLTVLSSRSHGDPQRLDAFLAGRKVAGLARSGSSLKFCRVAEGAADLYPRFGPTHEWDTAAGHAVLLAAGGTVETLDGQPLRYGKPSLVNPEFVAWGRR
jgi:3'(2'), 5'-bisphosphate nucleotidase